MRLLFFLVGTRGDIELYLPLARALLRRGHAVVAATADFYAARVREAGLEALPLDLGSHDELLGVMASMRPLRCPRQRTRAFNRRWVVPRMERWLPRLCAMAGDYDGFLSSVKMVLGGPTGVLLPCVSVAAELPDRPEGPYLNFPPQEYAGSVLNLVALNRSLADPAGLWPSYLEFTGIWHEDGLFPQQPAPELREFLESGPPPVTVTLGSMVSFDPERLTRTLDAALAISGLRGVVVGGWSSLADRPRSSGRIYAVREAVYDWLFARSACVVHHGSYGSAFAALRHAIPCVTLPQVDCQQRLGERLLSMGVSAGQFDTRTLGPELLADALRRAVSDAKLREACAHWRSELARDPGVEWAAARVEEHVRGAGERPGRRRE